MGTIVRGFSHSLHADTQGLWLDVELRFEDDTKRNVSFSIPAPALNGMNGKVYAAVVDMVSGTNPVPISEEAEDCSIDDLVCENIARGGKIKELQKILEDLQSHFAKCSNIIRKRAFDAVVLDNIPGRDADKESSGWGKGERTDEKGRL